VSLAHDIAEALKVALTGVTVYDFAVPNGTLPASYIIVRAGVVNEFPTRMARATNKAEDVARVIAVSRHTNPEVAASLAESLRSRFVPVLRDWRPSGSQRALRFDLGGDAFRDTSLPDVTFVAPVQYRLTRPV